MISELTGLMQAFRDETALIKSELAAQNEAFTEQLHGLVGQLQVKFTEIETNQPQSRS